MGPQLLDLDTQITDVRGTELITMRACLLLLLLESAQLYTLPATVGPRRGAFRRPSASRAALPVCTAEDGGG